MIFMGVVIGALVVVLAIEHKQNIKHQQILLDYANTVKEYAESVTNKCDLVSKQHDACNELVANLKGWYEITGMQYARLSAEIERIKEEN